MSSTITNLIVDRFLSEIIEIDANKTNSSFLSGDVKLDGIKIKKTIFQKLNLPYFDLVYGYIGKINIKISLNVWSNPIKVEVSDIFILVKHKPLDELNEQVEIEKMEQYKQSKLQSVEEIMAGVNEGNKNAPAQGGIVNNILNNLQLEIKNIVIRFEDAISYPNNPFAFGVILKKIFIKSTNKFFEDSDIFVKFSDVNYKIASIQGVNIYLDYAKSAQEIEYKNHVLEIERTANVDRKEFLGDEYDFYCYCMSELNSFSEDEKYHYYLLFNWTTFLNATINEAPKFNKLPMFKLEFTLSHLLVNIGIKHLTIICKLLAYISLNSLFRHGIEKKFYNKNPTLEEKKNYVSTYSQFFVEKYIKKKEANHLLETIRKFEEGLSYQQIEVLRSAASSGIESLKLGKDIEDVEMEIQQQQNQGTVGKLYSYFSSQKSIDDLNKKKELMISQKIEKQNEFEEQLKKDFVIKKEEDPLTELGHKYMLYDFSINTQYTKFTLSEDKSTNLITFYLKDFILQARMGLKWQLVNIYLNDISAKQFKTKNKYFFKILESVGDDVSDEEFRKQPITKLKNSVLEFLDNSAYERPGALNISFEINPELENSCYSLIISNKKRLLVYGNLYSLQYTSDKITSAIKNEFQVSEVSKMAKQEVAQLIDTGYQIANQVIQGEYQHTNIEVNVVFMGPKIILPHNIDDPSNCGCLMLNMGLIEVRSFLAPRKDKNIDYKLIRDSNMIYDIYKMNLTGFELLTVGDYYSVRNEGSDKTILKMIQNVNVKIEINNSIEPKNERFENFRIKFFIGDFKINIRDIQIEFIIYFYNHFNATNAKLAKEIEENNKKEEITQKTDLSIFAQSSKVQEKKNFIDLYKKATEIRMKDKKFAVIEFTLTKFELNFLKSVTEEEIAELEKNNLFNKRFFFKEFLNFNTNFFKFSITLTDRKNLYIEANISNISLFDYDYKFKVNEFLEEDKIFCLNKEFRCIMGSINDDLKPNQSRSESIYSEAHENSVDILGNKKSFIVISYVYNYQKKKQKIAFNLTKFSICNNFDTLLRIAKFGKYYSDLYGDVTRKTNDFIRTSIRKGTMSSKQEDNNLTYMNTQYSTNADEEKPFAKLVEKVSRKENNGVNKKFFGKVKERMVQRKLGKDGKGTLVDKSDRKEIESIEKKENEVIVLKPNVVKSQYLNKMKISFEMKEIELLFPQEPNSSNTKVLKFNYNIILKMRSFQEAECLYDDDVLIKMDYKKNEMDINLLIFNIDFDILNFLDNELIYNSLLTEKLICNSRISMSYNTFLILAKETSVSVANVHIEPITLVVGFRQIRVFQIFSEKGLAFWGELSKVLYSSSFQKTKTYKSKLKEKIEEIKVEQAQLELYNTNKFNYLFEVNFKMDKTQIKLIDNTSYYEVPLAKFELCKISFKLLQNSDPVDSHNMGIEIVEMISGAENKNYNLNNMYYYVNACFNIEILFFNERVSDWEPIMEPWNGEINFYQVAKMTRLKIFVTSDIILNINLTHQMMVIFNNIIKKLRQTESDWVDESKNISAIQAKTIKVSNDTAIEFKNYTGMNLEFWFDSDSQNKIEIMNGRTLSVTRRELEIIETNIDAEIGVFTKDKFSFRIIGYNIINNIDFSFNSMMMYPVSSATQYFEISVNILTKGNVRTVSFESNVYIYNNTHYAISLAVLNSKDLLNNVSNQEENPSVNFDNAYNDVITTDEVKKVPVTWILEPHVVFAKINQVDLNFYKMLYSELGFIYKIGNELKEHGDHKNSLKSFSKFISFSKDQKTCYIGLDILVLKSTSEDCKNYCYIIIINPPLLIHNSIPYSINLLKSEQAPREVIPLKDVSLYDIDIYDKSNSFKFGLNYLNDVYLESEDFFPSEKLEEKEKYVKLYPKNSNSHLKHYIVSKIRFEDLDFKKYFNVSYFKCEKFISRSKNMIFFVDFLVTNRLNQRVFIKVSGSKDNDPLNMLNSVMEPKQVNLFSFENAKDTKVNIRFEDTDWSRPFDVTTHGIEGVVDLNHYKEEDKVKRQETSVASVITSSSRFNHSTVLILEPRFYLVNKMPFDMYFRQTSRIKPYYSAETKIPHENSMMISLKAFKYKGFKKLLQFSLCEKDDGVTENTWSSDIDVDSLDDYNIKLRVPPRFDLEKYNIKEQNILMINNKLFILAKLITYTKDNGLIYLILNLPKYPQFIIRNNLSTSISVTQEGTNEEIMVPSNTDSSYCWTDCIMDKKRVLISIRDQKVKIAFEKIEKNKLLKLKDEQISFSIIFDNNNQTRILKIYSESKQENEEKVLKEMFNRRRIYKLTKVNINLMGFGLSIIDSTPKEMIYLSCYKIDINMVTNNLNTQSSVERIINFSLLLKNFQIDYCLEDSFKCLVAPKLQMKPGEVEEKAVNVTPFLQLLITFKRSENLKIESASSKFSQIDFTMQELKAKIDQEILNNILTLVISFVSVLDFTTYKANNIQLSLENEKALLPWEYEEKTIPDIEKIQNLEEASDEFNMIFIENLMVSSVKLTITVRINIEALQIQLIPGPLLKILSTLGNSLARITDAPMYFTEFISQNVFTDSYKLYNLLFKHYTKQGITQFYKIIGSSDLLGNPVGLLDHIGTGFIEFLNEPRKGFMQGPKKFGEGLAKGIGSLVGNVVGGGLDTVSKITGTLYSAAKNVTGDKVMLKEEEEPGNIVTGAYEGVKGCGMEVFKGVSGIFTNPYKQAKKEGVKGFFKGIGTGLLGAVISPFTAALKLGNSLIIGLRNTVTFFHKGKIITERYRHPRHINKSEALMPYDENYAEVQAMIRILGDNSDKKIIYFYDFNYEDQMELYREMYSTIIITDHRVILCYGDKKLLLSIELNNIAQCQVHISPTETEKYLLVFFTKKNEKKLIPTKNLPMCCQVYSIIRKIIK